jgi:hypothetical protein
MPATTSALDPRRPSATLAEMRDHVGYCLLCPFRTSLMSEGESHRVVSDHLTRIHRPGLASGSGLLIEVGERSVLNRCIGGFEPGDLVRDRFGGPASELLGFSVIGGEPVMAHIADARRVDVADLLVVGGLVR